MFDYGNSVDGDLCFLILLGAKQKIVLQEHFA